MTALATPRVVVDSVAHWRAFLESGGQVVPPGLFADDVFSDLTFPHWRVQTEDVASLVEARRAGHPQRGTIRVEKVLGDESGYVMKVEERWVDDGQEWYCREAFLCDLDADGQITEFSLYCTGDWDQARQEEHARSVTLPRP